VDATLALDPNNTEALSMPMGYYYQAPGIIGGDKTQAGTEQPPEPGKEPVPEHYLERRDGEQEVGPRGNKAGLVGRDAPLLRHMSSINLKIIERLERCTKDCAQPGRSSWTQSSRPGPAPQRPQTANQSIASLEL
jgi:hypothetical protein